MLCNAVCHSEVTAQPASAESHGFVEGFAPDGIPNRLLAQTLVSLLRKLITQRLTPLVRNDRQRLWRRSE